MPGRPWAGILQSERLDDGSTRECVSPFCHLWRLPAKCRLHVAIVPCGTWLPYSEQGCSVRGGSCWHTQPLATRTSLHVIPSEIGDRAEEVARMTRRFAVCDDCSRAGDAWGARSLLRLPFRGHAGGRDVRPPTDFLRAACCLARNDGSTPKSCSYARSSSPRTWRLWASGYRWCRSIAPVRWIASRRR